LLRFLEGRQHWTGISVVSHWTGKLTVPGHAGFYGDRDHTIKKD
jgi:hypothetical protein